MAFRMLSVMRVDLFNKLDQLAPAYLLRRRTGDLMGMATQDVEKVEYFFAHTIAPAFVVFDAHDHRRSLRQILDLYRPRFPTP